ncbi:hypothetical protein [Bacillus subtilis]|uniref:hypothetical protein n=1 Tax=Bacillus subtilis TaxID=1423 RepID=UPI0034E8FEF7
MLENPHYPRVVQGRYTTRSVTIKKDHQIQTSKLIKIPHTHEAIIAKTEFEAKTTLGAC